MWKWIKNELWNGYSRYERIYMVSMVLLQLIVYCFVPDSIIGMVCGIAGVMCVVLTAKGKISSYAFNFVQVILYMYICWNAKIYLEFGEQVFYFIVNVAGIFAWKNNMTKDDDGNEYVIAKKFKTWQWILTAIITVISTLVFGCFGKYILGSTLSFLDAFTISLSVIAQLLMVWRYREQWVIWIMIDMASLVMFIMLGNVAMVTMYIAWTINAFYGWYNWTKLNRKNKGE